MPFIDLSKAEQARNDARFQSDRARQEAMASGLVENFTNGYSEGQKETKALAETKRQRALKATQMANDFLVQTGQPLPASVEQEIPAMLETGVVGPGLKGLYQAMGQKKIAGEQRAIAKSDQDLALKKSGMEFDQNYKNKMLALKEKSLKKDQRLADTKQITPQVIKNVEEGNTLPKVLTDAEEMINNNADMFGPFVGAGRGLNPYDTDAQTAQANLKIASQTVGRFLEGGVLRKEDEVKYEKMLPQLSDTHDVAKNKMAMVKDLILTKQQSQINALQKSGYDTRGLQGQFDSMSKSKVQKGQPYNGAPMQVAGGSPAIGYKPAQEIGAAQAGNVSQAASHPQVNQAVQWAQKNPKDPRAQEILKRLGGQ